MPHEVFISHSSKDKLMADAICAGLEARGIRCWIAPRDILPGKNYAGQLLKAIETCKVFIVVLSENAISSTHILKEVELAIEAGGIIMPFRIQDVPLSDDLKYYLSNVHWLDALTPPLEKHIKKLADTLERMLGSPIVKAEPPFPDQPTPTQPASQRKNDTFDAFPVPDEKTENKRRKQNKWLWMAGLGVIAVGVIAGMFSIGNKLTHSPLFVAVTPSEMILPSSTDTKIQPTPTVKPTKTSIPSTPTASFSVGSTQVSPKDNMVLVYVPKGAFAMGSEENDTSHWVGMDAYWIDQTEVTNAMYAKCVAAGDCTKPANTSSSTRPSYYYTYADYPVINVNWNQADAYCQWAGRQLPTHAQWEHAARGSDGRIYPWGNETPACNLANLLFCGEDTWIAGSHPAGKSPFGVFDMAGNVAEWVADWEGGDEPGQVINPTGPTYGDSKLYCGGGWNSEVDHITTFDYRSELPTDTDSTRGFRCALPFQ